jgi:hypothetical protein
VQLDHLQTNVKLSEAEVDALFLATEADGREVIVCCEAKNRRDDVIASQILGEVRAMFRSAITQDLVLPIAVKAIAPSRIYVIEFEAVNRKEADTKNRLSVASAALYDLVPPVPGIGS